MLTEKDKKKFDEVSYKLIALCYHDNELVNKANEVLSEFRYIFEKRLKQRNQFSHLYRLLHAFRGFETGLRTFLECHGITIKKEDGPSMGCYLTKLQNSAVGFKQLDGTKAKLIQEQVVDVRNVTLHVSGKFPTEKESDRIANEILLYLEEIVCLSNKN